MIEFEKLLCGQIKKGEPVKDWGAFAEPLYAPYRVIKPALDSDTNDSTLKISQYEAPNKELSEDLTELRRSICKALDVGLSILENNDELSRQVGDKKK